MTNTSPINRDFSGEMTFTASRSSGPGGQNVNKVSTKVELRFKINESKLLTDEEKQLIFEKLPNKINNDGELIVVSQSERSQLKNKEKTIERFYSLIEKALKPKKKRKLTNPPPEVNEKRLESKRLHADKKGLRKGIS